MLVSRADSGQRRRDRGRRFGAEPTSPRLPPESRKAAPTPTRTTIAAPVLGRRGGADGGGGCPTGGTWAATTVMPSLSELFVATASVPSEMTLALNTNCVPGGVPVAIVPENTSETDRPATRSPSPHVTVLADRTQSVGT